MQPARWTGWTLVWMGLIIGATQFGLTSTSSGQSFTLETKVFVAEDTKPASRNVTLFDGNAIYDLRMLAQVDKLTPLDAVQEIVIFDPLTHKTILLDMNREVKLELLDLRILKILESMRAATLSDDRSKFLVEETFTEEGHWDEGYVRLTSPTITYEYHGQQPEDTAKVPPYLSYLKENTRLAATNPRKLPPFAKMRLDESITKTGWIPTELKVSIEPNRIFPNGLEARSTQVVTDGISEAYQNQITIAKQNWLKFRLVSLAEYRQLPKTKLISRLKKGDSKPTQSLKDLVKQSSN